MRSVGPQPTNTIAVASAAGIVVIDPGVSPTLARAKRERITRELGRSDFAYVIDTHDHGDHTHGNQAFADVTIVGQEGVPAQMEAGEAGREQTRAQIVAVLPGLRERLAGMELGDQTAELVYFGKAHSDTDILVYFPREGLMATGDLFYPENDLYIDSERVPFLSRWSEELDQAIPLFEKLADLFPETPNAFDSLGEAYIRAERNEDAAAAFERCLELDPENQNARMRLEEIRG